MRASGGRAGTQPGRTTARMMMNRANRPTSSRPGTMAPAYMSPTERPNWSAMTISTSEGGMIWASVPEAVMTPVAMLRL